jgi:hypothetical protein
MLSGRVSFNAHAESGHGPLPHERTHVPAELLEPRGGVVLARGGGDAVLEQLQALPIRYRLDRPVDMYTILNDVRSAVEKAIFPYLYIKYLRSNSIATLSASTAHIVHEVVNLFIGHRARNRRERNSDEALYTAI